MARININTDAVVKFTNRLEKMRKSDLPVVINQTLNSAAFDVKTRTMPKAASAEFTQRNKTFFKASSRVEKSSGFNIKSMKSTVGFIGTGTKKGAVRGLEAQERGGTIDNRDFVPMNPSRVSNAENKNVRKKNRISSIRNIDKLKNKKSNLRDAFRSGAGSHVVIKNTLFLVKKISKGVLKLSALYSFKKGRSVKIKATHFMIEASLESGQKLDRFFIENAKRRIKLKR